MNQANSFTDYIGILGSLNGSCAIIVVNMSAGIHSVELKHISN